MTGPSPLRPGQAPLRFGRVEISPGERVVRVDGQTAALGARAFDVLMALVRRRERLVTKQELLDEVWPGVVVEEHDIATQVGTLRKLLGPQAIATVPGRGYRFAAVVDDDVDGPGPDRPALLPAPVADRLLPMLGRDADLAALADLLERQRLVTLVGAGGMGKSLLARHLLARLSTRWPSGCCWVDLTSLADAAMLPACIAEAVGVRLAGPDAVAALSVSMAGLSMLVALDNAEHLGDGVARIAAALLDAAPGLRLLVTSQAPLRLAGEQVWRLDPLAVPPGPLPADRAQDFASVALFVERARGADANFVFGDAQAADAIELCRRLDGLPLAIELAAVRAPLVGVHRLVAMLENRLQLLTRSRDVQAPARQQTLRAALDWSHELLDDTERTVFRRLGIFAGSASLGIVQQVVADEAGPLDAWAVLDALGTLVDRSLVAMVPTDDAEPRYRLLETPRSFALEQLDAAGERTLLQRRHAAAFAAAFEAAWAERWSGRVGIDAWATRVLADASHARVAIDWAIAADEPAMAISIAATLYWALRRWSFSERMHLCDLCEPLAERLAPSALQCRALLLAVRPVYHPSSERSFETAERAVQGARALDREDADHRDLYMALCVWVAAAAVLAEPPLALLRAAIAEIEAIEREDWPPHRLADGWEARRIARVVFDDPARAEDMLRFTRLGMAVMQASGADTGGWVAKLMDAELACGNARAAVELGEHELTRLAHDRDEWRRLTVQANLALACLLLGDSPRARALLVQAWPLAIRFRMQVFCSDLPALLAALEGRPRAAARLVGYADAQWAARNLQRHPNEITARERCVARVHAALGSEAVDALLAEGRALRDPQVAQLAFADRDAADPLPLA